MIFYHFTSSRRVPSIHQSGLTLGHVPVLMPAKSQHQFALQPGFQWLTINPHFTQPWAMRFIQKEDRTEIRMTIDIPMEIIREHILVWTDVQSRFGWSSVPAREFNYGKEGANWYLWRDVLPPHLITETLERAKQNQKPHE